MMKKPNSKKILALTLALSMAATLAVCNSSVNTSKESAACVGNKDVVINILHTNDIHADVENLSYVAEYKDRTANAILVDGGDATQGQPLATYTKGESIIELMNAADYDLSAVGNHEFDYGSEQFLKNIKNAKFPFIAANIRDVDGSTFIESKKNNGAYTIIRKAGKRIGFFGITTKQTSYQTNPANIVGIEFEEELERAQEVADKLNNKGCDLVVGVVHVGDDKESNPTSIMMAEELEGVDVLIDGHSHSEIQYKAANGTYVVQTGTQLKNLGKVTVTFTNNDTYINTQLLNQEQYMVYGKDNKVDKLYTKATKKLEPILNQVVGKTETELVANEINEAGESVRLVRNRETSMGDLVADSMVWGAKDFLSSTSYNNLPVVAMTNGGGVRASIDAGDITIGEVFSVLPFGNTLSIKVATPDAIYKALEHSISALGLDANNNVDGFVGSYPQISGMRFEMDLTKTAYKEGVSDGERVVAVYLVNEDGSETLIKRNDTKTEIAFASNNFLIAGGDGYTMLADLKHIAEANVLDEVLADYITLLTEQAGGCFKYEMDGNRSVEINGKK